MAGPVHDLINRQFVAQHSKALSHLEGSSATTIMLLCLLLIFAVLAVLLLLWFIYLRRREEELEAIRMGLGGAAMALAPIPMQPGALAKIAREPFIESPICGCGDCEDPLPPIPQAQPLFTSNMHQVTPVSALPNLPMPVLNITPTTLMTTQLRSSGMGAPVFTPTIHQETTTVTTGPTPRTSKIEGFANNPGPPMMTMMPTGVGAQYTSNIRPPSPSLMPTTVVSRIGTSVVPGQITSDFHNPSISSEGILDPIFQLQQLQSSVDMRRLAEQNAIRSGQHPGSAPPGMPGMIPGMVPGMMPPLGMPIAMVPEMFMEMPYVSEGPDIPMTVSRVLGPSPTAGHPLPHNFSPPSLPPHLTEAGIRMSRANHPVGIMDLMPSGNILGLDAIARPLSRPGTPPRLRKTTTTTETFQPSGPLGYPTPPPPRPTTPGPQMPPRPLSNVPGMPGLPSMTGMGIPPRNAMPPMPGMQPFGPPPMFRM